MGARLNDEGRRPTYAHMERMTKTPKPGEVWLRRRDNAQAIVVADPAGSRTGQNPTVAWRALPKGRLNRTSLAAWDKKFTVLVQSEIQTEISDREEDRISALLIGRRIVRVEDGHTLVLDSGLRLDVDGEPRMRLVRVRELRDHPSGSVRQRDHPRGVPLPVA